MFVFGHAFSPREIFRVLGSVVRLDRSNFDSSLVRSTPADFLLEVSVAAYINQRIVMLRGFDQAAFFYHAHHLRNVSRGVAVIVTVLMQR